MADEEKKKSDWMRVFLHAPVHPLSHFLARKDFAALQTTSRRLDTSLRNTIRTRNEDLPMGKRMANLEGPFCVTVIVRDLMKREGRHPGDLIGTGGFDTNYRPVNTVMSLDLVTKRYTALAPMITARCVHATAVLDGKLFVMGGTAATSLPAGSVSSVECLDLHTGQWSEVVPMITARNNHGAAVLGGKIFVAGGCKIGTSVESYDPATNQWTAVTPMNTRRIGHGLVSAQGKLFAVGGLMRDDQGEDYLLTSVECFDPSTGVWSTIAALNTARSYLAVAVLGEKLYAIGGCSEDMVLSSTECLDLSVANSQWSPVAPMTTRPRCFGVGAVATGGKIYVAGGQTFERTDLEVDNDEPAASSERVESIQCFDPKDGPVGCWTVVSETSKFEDFSSFVAC